jgi:hypothetical protein
MSTSFPGLSYEDEERDEKAPISFPEPAILGKETKALG